MFKKKYFLSQVFEQKFHTTDYQLTTEGQIMKKGTIYTYQYFIKEHLGNEQLTFQPTTTDRAQSVQDDHYFPFGLQMPALTANINSPKLYITKVL